MACSGIFPTMPRVTSLEPQGFTRRWDRLLRLSRCRRPAEHPTLSNGTSLIKGKQVTGFSMRRSGWPNSDNYVTVPLTETELKKRGGVQKRTNHGKLLPWLIIA